MIYAHNLLYIHNTYVFHVSSPCRVWILTRASSAGLDDAFQIAAEVLTLAEHGWIVVFLFSFFSGGFGVGIQENHHFTKKRANGSPFREVEQ